MKSPFQSVRFRAQEASSSERDDFKPPVMRGVPGIAPARPAAFSTDEAAARHYLSRMLERDSRPTVRGLGAPQRPELVPDMKLMGVRNSPHTNSQIVQFEQLSRSVPIFGAHIAVELGPNRELMGIEAELGTVANVSPIASLTPEAAVAKIAELTGVPAASLTPEEAPALNFYRKDEDDRWHLVYFIKNVPAAPPAMMDEVKKNLGRWHGGPSPRTSRPLINYLVDAHDGEVVLYYSAAPMVARCRGIDELGTRQDFFALPTAGQFELVDPLRKVKTFDLRIKDVGSPLPEMAVRSASADWTDSNTAAVSAHVNAVRVYDFFNSVLIRDGVDDKGMELMSVVNCTLSSDETPPDWHNAVWWQGRMWYGQIRDAGGRLRSYARHLDVIAHELTHGVTEYSSNLVYRDESGALNESFSDIFGVIVNNWYTVGANSDVAGWSWEIGPGLGQKEGVPLRDLSNPKRTDDPDHMRDYLQTHADSGGVHTNSNIHNKAAHNVLVARAADGKRQFEPRDVAIVYYLTLVRLPPMATFKGTLQTLTDVVATYFQADPAAKEEKVRAIRDAYAAVGIVL